MARLLLALFTTGALIGGCVDTTKTATLPPIQETNWHYDVAPRPDVPAPEITPTDTPAADTGPTDVAPAQDTMTIDTATDTVASDAGPSDAPQGDAGPGWAAPQCTTITGTAAVTFTLDEGQNLALTENQFTAPVAPDGLVATDVPGLMLAAAGGTAIVSTDAGCNWAALGEIGTENYRLTGSVGGAAWAWTEGGSEVHVVDGEALTVTDVSPPLVASIVGFWADPADRDHARLVDQDGRFRQTKDGGATWTSTGKAPTAISAATVAAFDPSDVAKAIVGFQDDGVFYTEDGGGSWTQASGLAEIAGWETGAFSAVYSPADPSIVWVMGVDHTQALNQVPSLGKHIYRSDDGGHTFTPVIDHSTEVLLAEGMVLAPHPTDAAVLYSAYGRLIPTPSTDLYRYDHSGGVVTTQTNTNHGIGAIAFNPADSGVMYLGLEFSTIDL